MRRSEMKSNIKKEKKKKKKEQNVIKFQYCSIYRRQSEQHNSAKKTYRSGDEESLEPEYRDRSFPRWHQKAVDSQFSACRD